MPNYLTHMPFPMFLQRNLTEPLLYLITNMGGQSSLIRSLPVPAKSSPDIPHFQLSTRCPRSLTIPCLRTSCALRLDPGCSPIQTRKHYRQFGKRSSRKCRHGIQLNPRSMTYPSPTPYQSTRMRQQFGKEIQKTERIRF